MKHLNLTLIALLISIASFAVPPITGPSSVCVASFISLSDATTGGTWFSSDVAIATVSSVGAVGGVTAGTAIISYTDGVSWATLPITVDALPAPISGPTAVCEGASITETDGTPGGVWSSSNPFIASVGVAGIVTGGTSTGVATLTYVIATGCAVSTTVSVNLSPPTIGGPSSVCAGATASLIDAGGGLWSSSIPTIATIGSASGIVTGIAAGTATITYSLGTGCTTSTIITVNAAPAPITGTSSVCPGSSTTWSDATPGGFWTTSSTSVASVDPFSGIVYGIAAGVATISYTAACPISRIITVNPVPAPIVGPTNVCPGSFVVLSDATSGGVWVSSSASIATAGSFTGIVSGVSVGTATITYISPAGCSITIPFIVSAAPGPISGSTSVCVGATTALSDAGGGTWSSAAPAIASVGLTSGVVAGAAVGTTTISYSLGTGCTTSVIVTVMATPAPITGIPTMCAGATTTLSDAVGGGAWSSSDPLVANVGSGSGVVTGIAAGTATIGYWVSSGCTASIVVTVEPLPTSFTITGGGGYCVGGSGIHIGLSGSSAGVNYQLFVSGIAVGSPLTGTGSTLDCGLFTTPGIYTITGTSITAGCATAMSGSVTVTIFPAPTVHMVTGGGSYCVGSAGVHVGLDASDMGITYNLYAGAVIVATLTGTGSALDFGVFTTPGVYSIAAADATTACTSNMTGSAVIVSNPAPAAYLLTGGGSYCSGTSGLDITLGSSSTGVMYQLYDGGSPLGAPIPGTGLAIDFGLHGAGTYSVTASDATTGCTTTMTGSAVIVSTMLTPSVSIGVSPGGTICAGTSITFTATPVNGGTTPAYAWSVNGISAGTGTAYTYVPLSGDIVSVVLTSSLPCASPTTATAAETLAVVTPSVTATPTPACGGTETITASGSVSYSWAPSTGLACTTCASVTVNPMSTVVYTITGTDASGCVATATITADGNRISGHIGGGTGGSIKVWLIQYSSTDSSLTATDSTMTCMDGGAPYYEFTDKASGSYLVKAYELGGIPGTSGYLPTYGVSSAYWNTAASLTHSSGTDTMHVDMLYGVVPSGPGFIGGLIVSGAGRGTTDIPAVGILVYLEDAATGNILTYTYTNASGSYSFAGLANGSYVIYPEDYHYYTSPGYVITLSPSSESANAVDFKKHDTYGTITPFTVPSIVKQITAENGLSVFPNPTNGDLNIQWDNQATGTAQVTLTDVVGREVYKSSLDINAKSGQTQINLNGLMNGMYLITVKSGNINYSGKLMIQQ